MEFEGLVAEAIKASVRAVAERKRAEAGRSEASERDDLAYALSISSRVALRKGVAALASGVDQSRLADLGDAGGNGSEG